VRFVLLAVAFLATSVVVQSVGRMPKLGNRADVFGTRHAHGRNSRGIYGPSAAAFVGHDRCE